MINTNFLYLKYESSHLLVEQWKIQWHGLGPEALYSCQKCRGTWTNLFLLVGSCLLSKRQKDLLVGSVLPQCCLLSRLFSFFVVVGFLVCFFVCFPSFYLYTSKGVKGKWRCCGDTPKLRRWRANDTFSHKRTFWHFSLHQSCYKGDGSNPK